MDNIDVPALTKMLVNQMLSERLPEELAAITQTDEFNELIESAIIQAEPIIKAQLSAVSGPIFDYLLMENKKP